MRSHELTYQETLDIVEKFMIESKIRQYCTEICKGACCMDCYEINPNACRHHEGRRLPCSMFTCYELRQYFSERIEKILIKAGQDIRDKYYEYDCKFDPYFNVPCKTFMEVIRFPISIKRNLEKINIKKIKNIMITLIESKKVIYKK
jgi:hypothetical protein